MKTRIAVLLSPLILASCSGAPSVAYLDVAHASKAAFMKFY